MAIQFATTVLTIPRNLVLTGGEPAANFLGAFFDSVGNQLYVVATPAAGSGPVYWRRIDISNPLAPTGNAWAPTNTVHPSESGSSDTLADQNMFYHDVASGFVYFVYNDSAGDGMHAFLGRVNLSTGLTEFGGKQLLSAQGALAFDNPIRGLAVTGGNVFVVHEITGGEWRISKYALSAFTFTTTPDNAAIGTGNGVNALIRMQPLSNLQSSNIPVGLTVASDGKLLVFYDDSNRVEKYNATTLLYEGVTTWSASDISCVFERGGFLWTLNDVVATENIVLTRWFDASTNVISREKSRFVLPDRVVYVGEIDSVAIQFHARDDFGAPMTTLSGQTCRFEIVTNRGIIDADDAALSLSSTQSTFRNSSGVPLTRQLVVPFNGSGIATAYFQSVRTAGEQFVLDQIRIDYP